MDAAETMNYCPTCGGSISRKIPKDDSRERAICDNCGQVHYQNPLIVVGCVVECDGKVLLCKRAIEPRHGYWTVPAGFMELGETLANGAARETLEEACAEVEIGLPKPSPISADRARIRSLRFIILSLSVFVRTMRPGTFCVAIHRSSRLSSSLHERRISFNTIAILTSLRSSS